MPHRGGEFLIPRARPVRRSDLAGRLAQVTAAGTASGGRIAQERVTIAAACVGSAQSLSFLSVGLRVADLASYSSLLMSTLVECVPNFSEGRDENKWPPLLRP